MKKSIIALVLLGWQMIAMAQDKVVKTPEQRAQQFSAKLSKDLNLSEDQKNKIYTIAVSNFATLEKARAEHADDRKAVHSEMKAYKESFDKEVKGVLNSEQSTKWDQMKAERKSKRQAYKK
jgi:protein CpxP